MSTYSDERLDFQGAATHTGAMQKAFPISGLLRKRDILESGDTTFSTKALFNMNG